MSAAPDNPGLHEPTVVFVDHSYLHSIQWVQKFAAQATGIKVILVTDKSPSGTNGRLETINVRAVASPRSLAELQKTWSFSLYRTLAAERSYFDYTTFENAQCYSNVDLRDIEGLMACYADVLDKVIADRADLVIGQVADNAIAGLAVNIAAHHGRPCVAPFPYYWWADGLFFVDRPDQTSSEVDALYRHYYANPHLIDVAATVEIYSSKRASHYYSDSVAYPLLARLMKIRSSRNWYEPFSAGNWIVRRLRYLLSELHIKFGIDSVSVYPAVERYVLFPLHIAPEASLLGSTPELADQFSLIKDISLNLPWGVMLYVKRHPGQKRWSGPDYEFFRKMKALKNVRIIDASVPASKMFEEDNCLAVATINGTVGLEAAIKRKPVFLFGKAIYGAADCFSKPTSFDAFRAAMLAINRGDFSFNDKALSAMLMALNAAVWKGKENFAAERTTEAAVLKFFPIFESYINSGVWRLGGVERASMALDRSKAARAQR